jgi:hypothetical protein
MPGVDARTLTRLFVVNYRVDSRGAAVAANYGRRAGNGSRGLPSPRVFNYYFFLAAFFLAAFFFAFFLAAIIVSFKVN